MASRWRTALAAVVLLAVPLASCLGGEEAPGVVVETVTPVPVEETPERVGVATETPELTPPDLIVSTTEVEQGSAILVSVTGSVASGEAEFLGRRYALSQGDFSQYTYIGVGIFDAPGAHLLRVRVTLANGSTGAFERPITVSETEWEVARIYYVAEEGSAVLDQEERARETLLLEEAYARVTPGKLWQGRWRAPVEGEISSQFGERRSFNDGPVGGNHGGTDFAAFEGTPVLASNSGRVVLVAQLAVRGNTVIIDHGGGVLSGYAHLSSFAVVEGQMVAKGEVIAFVGNTGLSTAPHLHWEISVHGTLVDPLRFIDGRNGF